MSVYVIITSVAKFSPQGTYCNHNIDFITEDKELAEDKLNRLSKQAAWYNPDIPINRTVNSFAYSRNRYHKSITRLSQTFFERR